MLSPRRKNQRARTSRYRNDKAGASVAGVGKSREVCASSRVKSCRRDSSVPCTPPPRLMCRRGQTLWLQMGMLGASGALGPWGPGARASPGAKNFRFDSRSRTCSGHTRHGNRLRLQRCPGLVYRMASAWRSASRNSAAQPSKSGLCSMARSLRKSRSRRPERSGEDRTGTEGS